MSYWESNCDWYVNIKDNNSCFNLCGHSSWVIRITQHTSITVGKQGQKAKDDFSIDKLQKFFASTNLIEVPNEGGRLLYIHINSSKQGIIISNLKYVIVIQSAKWIYTVPNFADINSSDS